MSTAPQPQASSESGILSEQYEELYRRLVDPLEALLDDEGDCWQLLSPGGALFGRGQAPGSETELNHLRSQCRQLALVNEFAINGHENRISYIVGSGHRYRATPRKHQATPPRLAAQVRAVLDRFIRENQWYRRQQESIRRRDRDGEALLRFFASADGSLYVRFIEPEQVARRPVPPACRMPASACCAIPATWNGCRPTWWTASRWTPPRCSIARRTSTPT